MRPLTADDVTFYRREGYLLPGSRLFSSERHAELVSIFEEHLADKGEKLCDELDTPHFRDPRLLHFLLAGHRTVVQSLHQQGAVLGACDAMARGLHVLGGASERV